MAVTETLVILLAGVASYWGFFNRGEHFLYPQKYLQVFLITVLATGIFLAQQHNLPFTTGLAQASRLAAIYLFGVYSNTAIYRLFLNPLNKIPGPYFTRLSKFAFCAKNVKFNSHHVLKALHDKYGPFLRIGPNDISVIDADGTQVISGADSRCTKGPWYDQDSPNISMHTTRSRKMHDVRRKVWAPAFSDKALRGYEKRVQGLNDLLISKLRDTNGEPTDATKILNMYSFDVMGDLAFGEPFDMLANMKTHSAMKVLSDGMDAYALHLPQWFFRLLTAIPGATKAYWEFIGYCTKQLEKRIKAHDKVDPAKPDIIHTLIDHYNSSNSKKELWPLLCGDSRLMIVAGSDTTATTLTHLFYHLASKPEWQKNLREEMGKIRRKNQTNERNLPDQMMKEKDDAPVMYGMIHEALRLNPPVSSGVFRKTPPEGVKIRNTFIPGNTVIQMPQYAMGRSKDNYVDPDEFVPERWYSKPEMVKHKDAFAPFSIGPFGCIGRNLAYMEMRTVTSQIVDQFDVALAEGEDGSGLLNESVDHFTMGLKPLRLTFARRQ